jgi:hypothetical protein
LDGAAANRDVMCGASNVRVDNDSGGDSRVDTFDDSECIRCETEILQDFKELTVVNSVECIAKVNIKEVNVSVKACCIFQAVDKPLQMSGGAFLRAEALLGVT